MTDIYNIQDFGPSDLMTSDIEGSRRLKVSSEDFTLLVSKGLIAGHSMVYVNSCAESIGVTPKLIWPFASQYVITDTPSTFYLSSSNASDNQNVLIEWLDSNYEQQTSIIALTGQTPVAFAAGVGLRVNKCRTIGMVSKTLGDVYISRALGHTGGVPTNTAMIVSGYRAKSQTSNLALFSVPAGHTLFGLSGYFSAPKGRDNDFFWNVRNSSLGIPPTETNVVSIYQSVIEINFEMTLIPEKTDAYFTSDTQNSTGRVSCRVVGMLVDNEYL